VKQYKVQLRPAAIRELRKIEKPAQLRIQGAIALLATDPRPPSSRALRGRPGYRVRVGDYRIVYTIHDDVLVVVIITLGHRKDVYNLP